jgi:hypothetical protein
MHPNQDSDRNLLGSKASRKINISTTVGRDEENGFFVEGMV